jgi:hypothetical protein
MFLVCCFLIGIDIYSNVGVLEVGGEGFVEAGDFATNGSRVADADGKLRIKI